MIDATKKVKAKVHLGDDEIQVYDIEVDLPKTFQMDFTAIEKRLMAKLTQQIHVKLEKPKPRVKAVKRDMNGDIIEDLGRFRYLTEDSKSVLMHSASGVLTGRYVGTKPNMVIVDDPYADVKSRWNQIHDDHVDSLVMNHLIGSGKS